MQCIVRRQGAAVLLCSLAALAGCSATELSTTEALSPAGADLPVLTEVPELTQGFRGRVREADLLVAARGTLPLRTRRLVASTPGIEASLTLALASAPVRGRMVTLAAVDPSTYRRFTPEVTARAEAVWQRVAEGDLAITPELADELDQPLGGDLTLGGGSGATLRVGAEASLGPGIDAMVGSVRVAELGMVPANAMLVSTGRADPTEVAEEVRRRVGKRVTVSPLTPPTQGRQTAFLTGGSVADAVGSFSYRYFEDGRVEPDPAWVAANLRTETVPILGAVTCHRVMLPQLRGALQEVVDRGLAHLVDASDFGGCYAPRFIAGDPSKGLSLHTWGIAVDLNVQGNLRGTAGEIDRRVVDVFKRWGFAWGGHWAYTDPMHFELAALVGPGS